MKEQYRRFCEALATAGTGTRDIDKLKILLPDGHLLKEETIQELLCGNATLVIY